MWNRVLTPCTGATGQQLHCSTQSIGELAAVKLGLKTLRVESSNWDGRLALVVASDASVYEPGSAARATGMEQSNRVSLQNAGVLVGSKYQLTPSFVDKNIFLQNKGPRKAVPKTFFRCSEPSSSPTLRSFPSADGGGGGAGAVAMLVGPNAPLRMDPAWRATYAADAEDFSKPAGLGEEAEDQARGRMRLKVARVGARLGAGGRGALQHVAAEPMI
eukprot:1157615-Pelagomonas_calceolata.AAC.5